MTNDKICAILYANIPPYILLQGVREERSDHPLSRLDIKTPSKAQTVVDNLYRDVERRIAASPPGLCPVDMSLTFLQLCHAQTCGKCVPCRIGLGQLTKLIEMVLDGQADMSTLAIIEKTASSIVNTADCAPSAVTRPVWWWTAWRASGTIISSISSITGVLPAWPCRCPAWRCARRAWTCPAIWHWWARGAVPTQCA